jgi:hypothetical protein
MRVSFCSPIRIFVGMSTPLLLQPKGFRSSRAPNSMPPRLSGGAVGLITESTLAAEIIANGRADVAPAASTGRAVPAKPCIAHTVGGLHNGLPSGVAAR